MTAAEHDFIAGQAAKLAADLPANAIQDLAHTLASLEAQDWAAIRLRLLPRVPQPRFHGLVDEFLASWQARAPEVSPQSASLALLAASAAVQRCRSEQNVELVWTGPDTPSIPMRRTDQALLQVVNAAQRELLVVSFAVYQIDAVVQALIAAGRRGVRLRK